MDPFKSTFTCMQQELITIGEQAWYLCDKHLAKFAAHSSIYTQTYISEQLALLAEADAMPMAPMRNSGQTEVRVSLVAASDKVLKNTRNLKTYILRMSTKNLVNIRLNAAGLSLYEKAANENWTVCRSMFNLGAQFIAKYRQDLLDKGFMPAGFEDTFNADGKDCVEIMKQFYLAESNKLSATDARIIAFNNVYASLIAMFKDGQQIFYNDESIRRNFVFEQVVSKLDSGGAASLKGYITNNESIAPVIGVVVASQDASYVATTNDDGYYDISRIAAGDYIFAFSREGYETLTQQVSIKTGVTNSVNIVLQANQSLLKVA